MNLKFINIKNLIPYTFITISNISWFIFGLGKAETRLLKLDQKIMLLTSSKMHYFDMNTFEAAWNHHTPPIFYIFKLVFIFSEFLNIDFGFYVLHSLLLFFISLLLFDICYKLTSQKILSFLLSMVYVIDLSSTTIGGNVIFDNRTIGMVFQCLILSFAYKLLLNQNKQNTICFGIAVFLQVLFLESYLVSCGLLCIYLLYKLHKKSEFIIYFLITNISLLAIAIMIFWQRSELLDVLFLNYQFHFDSIGVGTKNQVDFFELSKFGIFYYWDHNQFAHVLSFIFIFIFIFFKDNLKIKNESKKMFSLIIVFYLFEIVHLFLTGPRFTNYLQVILLLQYLIIFIFIFFILSFFNIKTLLTNLIFSFVFITMFFAFQFGDVVYTRTSILDQSYLKAKEEILQDSKVSKFLYEEGDPKLVLSWISNESWDDIYFKANKLPSTRMWWWFEMKYVEDLYEWKPNRYYNSNLEKIFLEDLKKDNPRFAIIENNYREPPLFFLKHINENYILEMTIEKFDIYKLKN